MNRKPSSSIFRKVRHFVLRICLCGLVGTVTESTESFVNFETAPIHPIALSPTGKLLAVCNLPDNRVELFDLESGSPVPSGSVRVGLDPVTVRFRSDEELWVVNHISDSISII